MQGIGGVSRIGVAPRKKLIEVALPLDDINAASAREKSIRHGHPSTLHLWWARRPLAACRAVLFAQLVDDPSSWPELFATVEAQDAERERIFTVLRELVKWESSNNAEIVYQARREIAHSWARGLVAQGEAKREQLTLAEQVMKVGAQPTKAERATLDTFLAEVVPPVHDPFAGGGSIPLEAQRLGLRAIASDLNPVAVLINKALIEIPPAFANLAPVHPGAPAAASEMSGKRTTASAGKRAGKLGRGSQPQLPLADELAWQGAQGLAEDVRYYGAWMREQAQAAIGHLYPTVKVTAAMAKERADLQPLVGQELTVIAWLWARTVPSPDPAFAGVHVPLVSSFWLSTKEGKEAWVEPVVKGKRYQFEVRVGKANKAEREANDAGTKLGRGANFRCVLSNANIAPDYIKAEGMAGRMKSRMLAVVAEGAKGRVYLPRAEKMEEVAAQAEPEWAPDGDVPARLTGGTCYAYGLTTWGKLFTPRQLVALTTFSDLVGKAQKLALQHAQKAAKAGHFAHVSADAWGQPLHQGGRGPAAYAEAIAVYLAMAVDRSADRGSTVCTWDSSPKMEALRNTFGRQAIPMTWDYAEGNLFSESSGNIGNNIEWVCKVIDQLVLPTRAVSKVYSQDAATDKHICIPSTDPPYYDNIGYADLSDFFYVWLRRSLGRVYPALFSTLLTPKQEELIASPYRHGSKAEAESFFLNGMRNVLQTFTRNASGKAPTAIYYAFKQTEDDDEQGRSSTGWETFLDAVCSSGLMVQATWPMRTELANRATAKGTNALASSIVLSCTRRPDDARTITSAELRRELHRELPRAMRTLQTSGIAAVDLAQAAIGPGMAVFSRYRQVLESSGKPMSVRAALAMINEILDEHLQGTEGDFDVDTRFALTWFETHGFDAGEFGQAETLAKARAVSVAGLVEAGVVKSGGGKVRLRRRDTIPTGWHPAEDARLTVWEATQHLLKRLTELGESAAAELLGQLGSTAAPARDLAYRLYHVCEQKGWTDEARAYNALAEAWPRLQELAAMRPAAAQLPLPMASLDERRRNGASGEAKSTGRKPPRASTPPASTSRKAARTTIAPLLTTRRRSKSK